MSERRKKPYLWLIKLIGVIVPRRLRADWRQEWEAELQYRETLLAEWDKLDWRSKLDLLWQSAGAFADALYLQPKRIGGRNVSRPALRRANAAQTQRLHTGRRALAGVGHRREHGAL